MIRRPRSFSSVLHAGALAAVLLIAAALRLDAYVQMYGVPAAPAWLAAMASPVTSMRESLLPAAWTWPRVAQPYVGGDPMSYLRYGREMTSFYQGHIREPVFLATVRMYLALTGGQDSAVSLASMTYSVLYVLGAYLLGRAVASRWAGLLIALALALERELIAWAPEGWRDEAFGACFLLSTWAFVRLSQRRTWPAAATLGVLAAAACLTRITSLTFLVPGFVWLAWTMRERWRLSLRRVAAAAGVAAILVAPYLVNCWRVTGDPLVSINVHTRFYQFAETRTTDDSQTAMGYTASKFTTRPIRAIDTATRGLFVHPFETKWRGFELWWPGVGRLLKWVAAMGLFAWLWQPLGRFLLLMGVSSLAPYMLTWVLPGGGEWRFTMHVYALYLLAALMLVVQAAGWLREIVRLGPGPWLRAPGRLRLIAITAVSLVVLVAGASMARFWSPYLIARESLLAGDSTSIAAAPDDGVFFARGWTGLFAAGAVVARFAEADRAVLKVPLPEARPYQLVLRMDAIPGIEPPPHVRVLANGQQIAEFDVLATPGRVGSHALTIPPGGPRGRVAIEFLVERGFVPGAQARAVYPDLPPAAAVAFRLWYARLTPG
jgi:4-amino-4-deoxy-L-arabinose transferase-like glycosyltransferase